MGCKYKAYLPLVLIKLYFGNINVDQRKKVKFTLEADITEVKHFLFTMTKTIKFIIAIRNLYSIRLHIGIRISTSIYAKACI